MKCNEAEKLLPLFGQTDLDSTTHSAVFEHLESCASCRQLVEEFKDAQRLMRFYEPPEFSDEFFAGIRRSVLSEINQSPATSWALRDWLQGLFAPPQRIVVLTAAMLFIVLAVGTLYFMSLKSPAVHKSDATLNGGDKRVEREGQVEAVRQTLEVDRVDLVAQKPVQASRLTHKKRFSIGSFALNGASRIKLDPSRSRNSIKMNEVARVGSERASDESTLRIDIQTEDPNVRIIWFASNRGQSSRIN